VIEKVKLALSLIDFKSRRLVQLFSLARILLAGLDVIGVMLIGGLIAKSANEILSTETTKTPSFFNLMGFVDTFSLIQIALLSLFIFTLKSLLSVLFTKISLNVLARAESNVATDIYRKMMAGGFENFSDTSSQQLIFALNSSCNSAINQTLSIAVNILSESALLLVIGAVFAFVDFKVALGIIIYFSLVGFGIHKAIGPRMHKIGSKIAISGIDASTSLNDSVNAFREIYAMKKESEFVSKYSKGRLSFAQSNAYSIFYSGIPRYLVETALMFGAVILAAYLFKTSSPAAAAGSLAVFLTGSMRIMASMLPLQNAFVMLKNLNSQSEPFYKLVEKTKNIVAGLEILPRSTNYESKPLEVKFNNVTFSYPNTSETTLKEITFNISAGEYVALIGPSGAGKSTIADLLIKMVEPNFGSVEYINLDSLNARVGYVPQSPGIVSGSILENITLNVFSKEFDQKRLDRALESSHLSELIASLENGVNTDLGAHSDSLSGGQIQRIGLARALYANPQLLVLDEATSALDAETESAIAESLLGLRGQCSVLVIAHRLSTVQNADCVYVVDQGKIVASGKFSELAKSNDIVSRYVELSQLKID
jgi:ATP-binding cassette subfamily C protein